MLDAVDDGLGDHANAVDAAGVGGDAQAPGVRDRTMASTSWRENWALSGSEVTVMLPPVAITLITSTPSSISSFESA